MSESRLKQVLLVGSSVDNLNATIVQNVAEFIANGKASDLRIMFNSRRFMNPIFEATILQAIRKFAAPYATMFLATYIIKWRFPASKSFKLPEFDATCQQIGVHTLLLKIGDGRYLMPHFAEEFLRKISGPDTNIPSSYFLAFQHFGKQSGARSNPDLNLATKLFQSITELDRLESQNLDTDQLKWKLMGASNCLQKLLGKRMGISLRLTEDEADQVDKK